MATTFATGTAFGNTLTRIGFSGILHFQTQNAILFRRLKLVEQDRGGESTLEREGGLPIRAIEALNSKRAQEVRVGMLNALTTNRSAVTGTRSPSARTYGSLSANNMVDYEEAPALRSCNVYVEQSKHAVAFPTRRFRTCGRSSRSPRRGHDCCPIGRRRNPRRTSSTPSTTSTARMSWELRHEARPTHPRPTCSTPGTSRATRRSALATSSPPTSCDACR